MRQRLTASITLALLGLFATGGVASAAELFEGQRGVMAGTVLVVVIMLAVLVVFALAAHTFGLDKMPPPELDSNDGHGGGAQH